MKNTKKILVTGASGKLGRAIISSGLFKSVISPDSGTMNLTDLKALTKLWILIILVMLSIALHCQNVHLRG